MSAGDIRVILAPFGVFASVVRFSDTATASTSDEPIAAGTYVNRGSVGSPTDFLAVFETACNDALATLHGAGTISVDLQPTGRIRISQTGGTGTIDIEWGDAATTLDPLLVGFPSGSGAETIPLAPAYLEPDYQVYRAWYPRRWHSDDSLDLPSHDVAMIVGPTGRPAYLVHSDIDSPPTKRRLAWEDVASARIWDELAADTVAASVAGIAVGDPHAPLEWLVEYAIGNTGQVYVVSTEDPATHVQSGPYYVVLPEDVVSFGGTPYEAVRDDLRQRQVRVRLDLHSG